MALTKEQIHEQLVLLTMIDKSCKVLEINNLPKNREMLENIILIGYQTLLLENELPFEEIKKILNYYEEQNDLIFTNDNKIFFLPLNYDEIMMGLMYEDRKNFLNNKFDLFFDFMFSNNHFIPEYQKIEILVVLSREYNSCVLENYLRTKKTLVLTEDVIKRIRTNTWNSLHDDHFELMYEVLSNEGNSIFHNIITNFFFCLRELDRLPKPMRYQIIFEEDNEYDE